MATQSFTSFGFCILYSLSRMKIERKKDGPENCEKWASCCLKAIKYTSAKCHLEVESHKFCPFVGATRRQNQGCRKLPKAGWVSGKVEKIQEDSLDSIPSPSVKIQIIGGKVCLRCKAKTLLGIVNKLFFFKSMLTTPSNVLPLHLKQTFPTVI